MNRNLVRGRAGAITVLIALFFCVWLSPVAAEVLEPELPEGFVQEKVTGGLRSPAVMRFGPDGRLYVSERVEGELRVVGSDGTLDPEPALVVRTPRDGEGRIPGGRGYLSSGLRDFAFHPSFPEQPYLYAFYMADEPRHNRVSRFHITNPASEGPYRADAASEEVLIELPFANPRSSGSHNGGAMIFCDDGMLYFTTGDGWEGGDPVQSLGTYTGKVFRLHDDGAIPRDNPFYERAEGPLRAIYAVGLRNPFTMTKHPESGAIYVNDCAGHQKTHIHRVQSGANFGFSRRHSYSSQEWDDDFPGTPTEAVATAALEGTHWLITGGAWYPSEGPFPEEYHGSYFACMWGPNGPIPGAITRMIADDDPEVVPFARNLGGAEDPDDDPMFITSALKPAQVTAGPDGHLYWLATTYRTSRGMVLRIRYAGGNE